MAKKTIEIKNKPLVGKVSQYFPSRRQNLHVQFSGFKPRFLLKGKVFLNRQKGVIGEIIDKITGKDSVF